MKKKTPLYNLKENPCSDFVVESLESRDKLDWLRVYSPEVSMVIELSAVVSIYSVMDDRSRSRPCQVPFKSENLQGGPKGKWKVRSRLTRPPAFSNSNRLCAVCLSNSFCELGTRLEQSNPDFHLGIPTDNISTIFVK